MISATRSAFAAIVRLGFTAPQDGKNVTLFLTTSDASDGNEHDFAVWENPRFVARERSSFARSDGVNGRWR